MVSPSMASRTRADAPPQARPSPVAPTPLPLPLPLAMAPPLPPHRAATCCARSRSRTVALPRFRGAATASLERKWVEVALPGMDTTGKGLPRCREKGPGTGMRMGGTAKGVDRYVGAAAGGLLEGVETGAAAGGAAGGSVRGEQRGTKAMDWADMPRPPATGEPAAEVAPALPLPVLLAPLAPLTPLGTASQGVAALGAEVLGKDTGARNRGGRPEEEDTGVWKGPDRGPASGVLHRDVMGDADWLLAQEVDTGGDELRSARLATGLAGVEGTPPDKEGSPASVLGKNGWATTEAPGRAMPPLPTPGPPPAAPQNFTKMGTSAWDWLGSRNPVSFNVEESAQEEGRPWEGEGDAAQGGDGDGDGEGWLVSTANCPRRDPLTRQGRGAGL